MTILREELDSIKLCAGDLTIQRNTGFIGMLLEHFCNPSAGYFESSVIGNIWFWRISWLKNIDRNKKDIRGVFLNPTLEEEGLKMSIFIGNVEHYSKGTLTGVDNEL